MKINELLVENEQLDELNLKGLGQGLGKAVGAVGGGIVQGAKNVWSGMKQGYQAGQAALAPDETGSAPAAAPAAAPAGAGNAYGGEVASNNLLARAKQGTTQDPAAQAPAAQGAPAAEPAAQTPPAQTPPAQTPAAEPAATPAADQQSKIGVGQINKIIPKLRTRDLNSVKKTVDTTLAQKQKQPAAEPAAGAAPAGQPNLQVQQGGKAPAEPEQPAQPEPQAQKYGSRGIAGMGESYYSKFLGMDI